jgi:hypothetical protein
MALQDVGIGLNALRSGQQDILRALGSLSTSPEVGVNLHTLILLVTNLTANMVVLNGRLDQVEHSVMGLERKIRQQGELCVETKRAEDGWSGDYAYRVWSEWRHNVESYLALLTLQLGHHSRFGLVLILTVSVSCLFDPLVFLFFVGIQLVHGVTDCLESAHDLLDRCPTFLIRPREASRRAAEADVGIAEAEQVENAEGDWWFGRYLTRLWPRAQDWEVIPAILP